MAYLATKEDNRVVKGNNLVILLLSITRILDVGHQKGTRELDFVLK